VLHAAAGFTESDAALAGGIVDFEGLRQLLSEKLFLLRFALSFACVALCVVHK
jgi:hypothetical protein